MAKLNAVALAEVGAALSAVDLATCREAAEKAKQRAESKSLVPVNEHRAGSPREFGVSRRASNERLYRLPHAGSASSPSARAAGCFAPGLMEAMMCTGFPTTFRLENRADTAS